MINWEKNSITAIWGIKLTQGRIFAEHFREEKALLWDRKGQKKPIISKSIRTTGNCCGDPQMIPQEHGGTGPFKLE